MSTFGSRLKEVRENLKLSREELAHKLNITYTALSKYETDKRFPNQEALKSISETLGISIDYLVGINYKGSVEMDIKATDLKIEVGVKAYEFFTGCEVNDSSKQVYPEREEYRYGIFIEHMPTGKCVYSNSERSQIKNKNKALEELEKQLITIRYCAYCNGGEMYTNKEDCHLLEIGINGYKKCLEVHYFGETVLDYENIKIKYCPFCGREL